MTPLMFCLSQGSDPLIFYQDSKCHHIYLPVNTSGKKNCPLCDFLTSWNLRGKSPFLSHPEYIPQQYIDNWIQNYYIFHKCFVDGAPWFKSDSYWSFKKNTFILLISSIYLVYVIKYTIQNAGLVKWNKSSHIERTPVKLVHMSVKITY